MAQQGSLEFPLQFFPGEDGLARPYLVLDLHAPDQVYRLRGVVDSGADLSVLPLSWAPVLGYDVSELERTEGQQVQGKLDLWEAKRPITAAITGLEELLFDIQPTFLDGTTSVLWGRIDFMKHWDVVIRQGASQFVLIWQH